MQEVDRLRAQRGDVPVLVMSGYAESEVMQRFAATDRIAGFLPKPFRADTLVQRAGAALGGDGIGSE